VPSGDLSQVFDRALGALVKELSKRKFADTARPRRHRGPLTESADISAEAQRIVWARDGGACAFVSKDGRRCGSRRFVEFHHVIPRAAGGKATVENIELRCRAHNGYEVTRYFGASKRYVVPERPDREHGRMTRGPKEESAAPP